MGNCAQSPNNSQKAQANSAKKPMDPPKQNLPAAPAATNNSAKPPAPPANASNSPKANSATPQVASNLPPAANSQASKKDVPAPVSNVPNPVASPPISPKSNSDNSSKDGQDEMKKLLAISKIQKQARRKSAIKAAQAEVQWKLFADLDTKDEAEMLSLAVFMQTLLDIIPNENKPTNAMFNKIERAETLKELNRDEDDGIGKETTEADDESFITLKSVNFAPISGSKRMHSMIPTRNNEWDFCHMNFDALLVSSVIDGFRQGKRLTKQSVVKVLRRCYKTVLQQKNTNYMTIDNVSKLTVVGDLHGQMTDLFHILDESGLPNENNKFIFNGDFVDRGENSFEVVFTLLLLYSVYGPSVVSLNRGNHEDASVCRVYGFEEEILRKYDELIFEMFVELFNNLPLFSLVNQTIFVVHGGIFHEPKVTLNELELIPRTDYFVKPAVPYPENLAGLSEEDCYREYLKQLQRDALWSDPIAEDGCYLNHRGAGIVFGPNIAREFMRINGLSMIIRSHECVYKGFELPFQPAMENSTENLKQVLSSNSSRANRVEHSHADHAADEEEPPFLCTLFSASNYTRGDNFGAIIQFAPHAFAGSKPVKNSSLHYVVKRYRIAQGRASNLVETNKTSLKELILKKKNALVSAFEAVDTTNCGSVSRLEWAEVMQRVTLIKILWLSILPTIVPTNCLSPNAVHYRLFIDAYTEGDKTSGKLAGKEGPQANGSLLDDFYGQRKKLESVFYFFDTNGDGVISAEEFRNGCALINKSLHPDCQLKNVDRMLQLMDFDGSGSIDINEFFETFRILDAKDGKVDGVISIAKKSDTP